MPANIIIKLPTQIVFIQIPTIPPVIPIINIKNKIIVLEFVGKIYEAIKLEDEPAGDVKQNIIHINTSSKINYLIHCEQNKSIPEVPKVISSIFFLPILSK
jgi:hypothetical protein